MKVLTRDSGGILIVTLRGEIRNEDNREIETLFDEIEIEKYRGVVVDLSGLDYINSRAIGSLMALWKQAAAESITVASTRPKPLIARLLTAVGLYRLLPVYESVEEALKTFPK